MLRDVRFAATDQTGTVWHSRRVVMATGVSRPYIPAIAGIETAEQYATVSVDPDDLLYRTPATAVTILGWEAGIAA